MEPWAVATMGPGSTFAMPLILRDGMGGVNQQVKSGRGRGAEQGKLVSETVTAGDFVEDSFESKQARSLLVKHVM
jgi:hypothetical protein